jgi:hypothetical protein
MIKIIRESSLNIPVTVIEWAPRNWSSRENWGPEAQDGFYLTQAGELYRLNGPLVIYVTQAPFLH